MSLTRHFSESRLEKSRANEAKAASLRKMLSQHNIIAGHCRSDIHVEQLRRSRCEEAERRELLTDYSYVRREQDRERKDRVAVAEERLADAVAERKAACYREEMNRRRICAGSEELRSLKQKLHAAKVNKERAQQLLTQQVNFERERVREHMIAEHMGKERLEHQELEHKLDLEKQRQRYRVKAINQEQMFQKELQKGEALWEYAKEKEQVREIVDRIEYEDAQEVVARACKKEEVRESIRRFELDRMARREGIEEQERRENIAIERYNRSRDLRETQLAKQNEQETRQRERILRDQISALEQQTRKEAELEELRSFLHQEEIEEQHQRREEIVACKKLEDREELRCAYEVQMQAKAQQRARALREEEEYREALLRKFAEDDRIEQMNDARRRMKVQEHKREAQRLVDLRREMYENERRAERAQQEALLAQERERQAVIEAERQRLLMDQAVPLHGFLPKGTLSSPEDLPVVFPDARAATETSAFPRRCIRTRDAWG